MQGDRRIQRTRNQLRKALIELIGEYGYEAITVQHIVDRANVGRTTFYQHYRSKDDLFVDCHETIVSAFHLSFPSLLSSEELLSVDVPSETIAAYRHLDDARVQLYPIFQGKDALVLMRLIRDKNAQDIEAHLRATFAETETVIPFSFLALYLAGAQLALVQWLLEKRQPFTPEQIAQTFHRLQRAAIREALSL